MAMVQLSYFSRYWHTDVHTDSCAKPKFFGSMAYQIFLGTGLCCYSMTIGICDEKKKRKMINPDTRREQSDGELIMLKHHQ